MQKVMSPRGSSADSSNSYAQTRFATGSSTADPRTSIRGCSSRAELIVEPVLGGPTSVRVALGFMVSVALDRAAPERRST